MIDKKGIDKAIVIIVALAVILVAVLSFACGSAAANGISRNGVEKAYATTLFGDKLLDINIEIDDDQWQDLLKNATSEEYYPADVTVNGTKYSKVAVRAKGNTSLSQVASSGSDRFSLKIKFNEYVDGQNCDGLTKLVLNNNYCDATMMKEAIVYDMFAFLGSDASLYNYAKVSVNGEYTGLYLALEPVEEDFCERVYGTNYGRMYKPDSMEMGGGKGNMKNFDMDKFDEKFGPDKSKESEEDSEIETNEREEENQPPDKPQGEMPQMERGGQPPEMPGRQEGGQPPEISQGEMPQRDRGGQSPEMSGEGQDGQQPPEIPRENQGEQQSQQDDKRGGPNNSGNGADLNYTDDNEESYSTIWDGAIFDCTAQDKSRVIEALQKLCDTDSSYETLSTYIDVENLAKYMAVHTFSVNLDSLSGNMTHNYYLYEQCGMLNLVPWDYNLAFGGFQSGNASSVINFSISWPFSNMSEEDRQLFANLLNCPEFKTQYYANLKKLATDYVLNGRFEERVKTIRANIDELVKTDPTAFYSYSDYEAAQKVFVKTVKLRAQSVLKQIDKEGAIVDAENIDLSVMGSQGGRR